MKSEPQKAGGSDRALAQRLWRRGAGKDGIRGRCAGSRRPSSPAGPWLAGPAVTAATHDIRRGRTGACLGGLQPVLPRQRCGPPSQRSDAGLLRVPGRRFPVGPCARDAVTAVPGQAASRPQGTCAWGGSALPLPGPDPGTQRSQGHSSLRSGDTKVRLRGGESGGRGQRPGSEARAHFRSAAGSCSGLGRVTHWPFRAWMLQAAPPIRSRLLPRAESFVPR